MRIDSTENTNWILRHDRGVEKSTADAGFSQSVGEAEAEQVEAYQKQLAQKYGVRVRVESISKDRATLERLGRGMRGNDVVIAPNILAAMAGDSAKAAYYEGKIADFFHDIPRQSALFAAQGLVYEPCGVVIHEDGTVTYIGGCSDSPERVAEVNRIHREKQEKELEALRARLEERDDAGEALREQLSAMAGEWKANASLRRLLLWSDALQSARKDAPLEQKSLLDILFENRAENHEAAMELSRRLRAAAAYDNPLTSYLNL